MPGSREPSSRRRSRAGRGGESGPSASEAQTHLGRFLRECRERLGLTSRQVAELTRTQPDRTPISHSNVLAIERGRHVPTLDKVLTLSAIYGVAPGHFIAELRRDMVAGEDSPTLGYADAVAAAARARAAGQLSTAVELYAQALRHGEAAEAGDGAGRRPGPAAVRLELAGCYAQLGLATVAQRELERVLGDDGSDGEERRRAERQRRSSRGSVSAPARKSTGCAASAAIQASTRARSSASVPSAS